MSGSQSDALIIQGHESGPPRRLGAWLQQRDVPFQLHRVWADGPVPAAAGRPFVAMLGSPRSVNDTEPAWIGEVKSRIAEAIAGDTPVLGICFGAQTLSAMLGGTVARMPRAEVLWREIDSDGGMVPRGPWCVWHYEAFTVPPGAEELASSEFSALAFRHGRHLGVQFHAETTPEGSEVWMEEERELLAANDVDVEELRRRGRELEPLAGAATERLFSNWWEQCVSR